MKCPTCYLTQGPMGFALVLLAAVVLIRTVAGGGVAPVPPMFDKNVTLEQVVDRSKESGKPVFAFLTADWCAPCQAFKRGALADKKVVSYVSEKTEPVYIDIDEHPDLAQAFGISGVPTVAILQDGKILDARSGAMPTGMLLAWLDQTLPDND